MDNDYFCKVVGVRIVKIKIHDGVIHTLMKVKHIPYITKNSISLGAFEDVRCKFQSEGGVHKVSKGALILMNTDRINTLYFLRGSTITGSAAIACSTSDTDNTKLWHMKLGNMSERGMTILSKRGLLCGLST